MRGAEQQLRAAEVQPGFGSQVLFCGSMIHGDPAWTFCLKNSLMTSVAFESLLRRFGLVLLELLRSGSVDTSARTAYFNTVPTSKNTERDPLHRIMHSLDRTVVLDVCACRSFESMFQKTAQVVCEVYVKRIAGKPGQSTSKITSSGSGADLIASVEGVLSW